MTVQSIPKDRFAIRIDADGVWHYQGSPIQRKEMVCLFASVLHRLPDGQYMLATPVERGLIDVDDVPFVGVELFTEGKGKDRAISVRTNIDEIVTLSEDYPLRVDEDPITGEPRPYVLIRRPTGIEARLSRAVFYELVDLAEPDSRDAKTLGVWSMGRFFPLGRLSEVI